MINSTISIDIKGIAEALVWSKRHDKSDEFKAVKFAIEYMVADKATFNVICELADEMFNRIKR